MRLVLPIVLLMSCSCAHRVLDGPADTREIRRAALGFMLERWGRGSSASEYSAHVVPPEFVSSFRHIIPAVVAHDEKRYPTKGGPAIDLKTRRAVVLWSVSGEKVEGETATCYVTWYIGNLGAGGHTVFLRKQGDSWIAQREEMMWVSQTPNKAPEPTPLCVTPRAYARAAPRSVVAHL